MNENEPAKTAQLWWKQWKKERAEMEEMLFSPPVQGMSDLSEDSKMFGTYWIFFE